MIDSTARDYEKIFEELKRLAKEYSAGRWTDFTDGDFGTVIIHLLSYVGDLLSNQIDTTANELFLFTAEERTSLMEIAKLVGYEPRHFMSALATIKFTASEDITIPRWATWKGAGFEFHNIKPQSFLKGKNTIYVYEGTLTTRTFTYNDIDENGCINLQDYYVAFNTVHLDLTNGTLSGEVPQVEDARFNTGDSFTFSCHLGLDGFVYIQLPSFWQDTLSQSSKLVFSYLRCHGESGNIENNIITTLDHSVGNYITIDEQLPAIGGLSPETVSEMKLNTMVFARTMHTIVTKKDFEDLSRFVPSVATLRALDYLDEESGYVQPSPPNGYPNDAYKTKLVVVPANANESSIWYTDSATGEKELTEVGVALKEFVDDKRLATLYIEYEDPTYIVPDIILYLYMDDFAIRKNAISSAVVDFIKTTFGRYETKIGQSIRGSVIGKQILNYFEDIDYVNIDTTIVGEQEGEEEGFEFDIKAGPLEFIDMANAKYTVYVNDTLQYVPDGNSIVKLGLAESTNLNLNSQYNFLQFYVTKEDYEKNKSLVASGVKPLWEEDGRKLVLTIPNDMMVPVNNSSAVFYQGLWDIETSYGQDDYVVYFGDEELVFSGMYNSAVSYSKKNYVFNDGYYYESLIDKNDKALTDGSAWSKMSCYYRSTSDYNKENVPSISDNWVTFDPYTE